MNTSILKRPIVACLALASAGLLSSCVDPYYAGGGPPQRGGSYQSGPYQSGYSVRTLPPGYRTERYGNSDYYYSGSNYYQRRANGYVVVDAPRQHSSNYPSGYRDQGGMISRLPPGSRTIDHRTGRYYQSGNVYYQQRGSGYVVVQFPR
jgi:hypothetical protein